MRMKLVMKEIESLGLTKQRTAVLRAIRGSEKHMTANEVFEGARGILPSISFATVYNSLNYLKKKELIGEVQFGAKTKRYDRRMSRHDHAICSECGLLVDLEMSLPEGLLEEAASRLKFDARSIELTLRGLCPDCK